MGIRGSRGGGDDEAGQPATCAWGGVLRVWLLLAQPLGEVPERERSVDDSDHESLCTDCESLSTVKGPLACLGLTSARSRPLREDLSDSKLERREANLSNMAAIMEGKQRQEGHSSVRM